MYRISAFIILAVMALSGQSAHPLRRSARLSSRTSPAPVQESPIASQAVTSDVDSDDDDAIISGPTVLPVSGVALTADSADEDSVVPIATSKFSLVKFSAIIALIASIGFGIRATLMQ
jgi:hypothetical protein